MKSFRKQMSLKAKNDHKDFVLNYFVKAYLEVT